MAVTILVPISPREESTAVLYLPKQELDLGIVQWRGEREVTFSVLNKGQRRLVINEVDNECACGQPVRRTVIIPPGGVENLVVNIDTRSKSVDFENLASFTTNDVAQPRFDLRVRASVASTEQLHGADANQQVSVLVFGKQ